MAGRFRFQLEVVRKLRQEAMDTQRRTVAHAIGAVRRTERRVEQLTEELRATIAQTRDSQQVRRLDIVSLRGHQYYRGRLHRQIMESDEERAKRQAILDRERAKLAKVTMRLKVIEKLREKQWNRHATQLRREEQAGYDETAVQAYARRQRDAVPEVGISC